jgi:hypothetical protein
MEAALQNLPYRIAAPLIARIGAQLEGQVTQAVAAAPGPKPGE